LRAEQRLDSLDVDHLQVHEQRYVAQVGGDRAARAITQSDGVGQRTHVQAADSEQVAGARPLVRHVQSGNGAREFSQVVDAQRL